MYVQIKALKSHVETLKWELNYSLEEDNDSKVYQQEEKYQVVDLQELMDKTILKPAALNRSAHFNMQKLREEHDKSLDDTKDNGTTETIKNLISWVKI